MRLGIVAAAMLLTVHLAAGLALHNKAAAAAAAQPGSSYSKRQLNGPTRAAHLASMRLLRSSTASAAQHMLSHASIVTIGVDRYSPHAARQLLAWTDSVLGLLSDAEQVVKSTYNDAKGMVESTYNSAKQAVAAAVNKPSTSPPAPVPAKPGPAEAAPKKDENRSPNKESGKHSNNENKGSGKAPTPAVAPAAHPPTEEQQASEDDKAREQVTEPVTPLKPDAGETLPEDVAAELSQAAAAAAAGGKVPAPVDMVTVSFAAPGVTAEKFTAMHLDSTKHALSGLSGTPASQWQHTLQAGSGSAATAFAGSTGQHRRLLQPPPSISTNLTSGSAAVTVMMSILTANPRLVVYRLSQPVVDLLATTDAPSCTKDLCYRLFAAGVPVVPGSIRVSPDYDNAFSGIDVNAVDAAEQELGRKRRLGGIIGGGVAAGIVLLVFLASWRKLAAWFKCGRPSADAAAAEGKQEKQQKGAAQQPSTGLRRQVAFKGAVEPSHMPDLVAKKQLTESSTQKDSCVLASDPGHGSCAGSTCSCYSGSMINTAVPHEPGDAPDTGAASPWRSMAFNAVPVSPGAVIHAEQQQHQQHPMQGDAQQRQHQQHQHQHQQRRQQPGRDQPGRCSNFDSHSDMVPSFNAWAQQQP